MSFLFSDWPLNENYNKNIFFRQLTGGVAFKADTFLRNFSSELWLKKKHINDFPQMRIFANTVVLRILNDEKKVLVRQDKEV